MLDDLAPKPDAQTELVLLGRLPKGVTWPVNQHGMENRNYPEPDWIIWLQRAKVSTIEAACLSMGWCPFEWGEWHSSVPLTAQIRETARPYLDMLAQRADIFGNHCADVTVGENDEKMISLSSARRIASAGGWDVAEEFQIPQSIGGIAGLPNAQMRYRLSKRETQIIAIETAIKTLGYVAMSIEKGGKTKIKAECKRTDNAKLFGAGDHPFLDAWKEALRQKRVRMVDHDKYGGM